MSFAGFVYLDVWPSQSPPIGRHHSLQGRAVVLTNKQIVKAKIVAVTNGRDDRYEKIRENEV